MKKSYLAELLNGVTYVFAAMQANEVFQIIELCLSIVTSVVLIAFRLWKWHEAAIEDGKITKDEIKEGLDILADGAEDLKKKGEEKDDG